MEFINEGYIDNLLDDESLLIESLQKEIIHKAAEAKGLTLRESAALLNIYIRRNYSMNFFIPLNR